MKPPAFEYHRPQSLDQALDLLARLDGARVLAGGQSLMPMLNFRIVSPPHLIDVNRVASLAGIRDDGDTISFGALTRQREIEHSPLVAKRLPLVAEAILQVGHRQTRNRGTLGGSLCHLDPSAELPTVAMALDAELEIASTRGTRRLPMAEFAAGYMTNALAPDEMLCAVHVRPWPASHGAAFVELARRKGDFAIVSAAALVELDAGGIVRRAALTLGGAAATPLRMPQVEAALAGIEPSADAIARAVEPCGEIDALSDPAVPAWYRQHLAVVLASRALTLAVTRARGAGK